MCRRHFLVLALFFVLVGSYVWAGALYRISGILDIQKDGKISFTSEDSKVFELKMSSRKAKKYDGQLVQIDGIAEDGLNTKILKVKRIRSHEKKIETNDLPFKVSRRPAKIVQQTDKEVVVDNVRWSRTKQKTADGQVEFLWRQATIKPELVDKTYFVLKPFAPEWIAAHSLMLFTFKDGGFTDQDGNNSKGLVLTIEAHLREGQNYGLVEGLRNRFGIVWLLTTWEDYAAETCHHSADDSGRLVAYEINFDQEQNQKLLLEALKHANVNRLGEVYHTTRNNCTNNLVLLMNKFSERKMRPWTIPSMIYNVRATMPVIVPKALQRIKMLGQQFPDVNKDNFFVDPDQIFKINN